MATTPPLDNFDRLARLQELYLALNGPDSTASTEAMRELSGMGYSVEQDPTGSSFVVTPGKNMLSNKPSPNSGSLSQRPASPVGKQGSGFGSELQYHHRTPGVGLLSSKPPARSVSDVAARAAVLGATAPPAAAPATPGVVAAIPAGRTAFSMGAPALDDRVDATGRSVPGTQSFVRGLFATADNANKALVAYKKQNPNSNSQNDPQHRALEQAVSSAVADSNAGSKWASMTPSARQSVLTQGELASGRAKAVDLTQQGALEQRQAESERIFTGRPSNLLEDGQYFRDTGVMRGGAGIGTSTTQAGGVIAPAKSGGLALTSPYGTGSSVRLTPEQQANRPEAMIEGVPASQYFDKAAMRQGQTFDVGGKHYSPELSPEEYKQKQLEEAKRKAAEARKNFAASILKR